MSSYYEKMLATGEVKCIDEEIPFEIPQGWEWCRMGSIGDWGAGATPAKGNPDYYGGSILWLRTGELNNGIVYDSEIKVTKKALQECSLRMNRIGDVLIAMYGATIGKVAIVGKELTTNQACCACTPFGIYNYFLFFFLMGSQIDFIKKGEGGAQPNISREKLVSHLMPIPPLTEQYRIVEKIQYLLPLVEKYSDSQILQDKLNSEIKDKLRKSILQEAIQGKLVPQIAEEGTAHELLEQIKTEKQKLVKEGKLKKSVLNDSVIFRGDDNKYYQLINNKYQSLNEKLFFKIPTSWCWVQLRQVAIVARGGSPRPIKDYLTDSEDGINWIKIGDTEQGGKYINATKEKICPKGVSKSRFVHKGDFLLTNSMSFGRPYITNIDGCIHDGWLVISPFSNTYNQNFLYYLLSSNFAYRQFVGKVAGGVVKNLNSDKVADAIFPLPPLEEQQRIVAQIEKLFEQLH